MGPRMGKHRVGYVRPNKHKSGKKKVGYIHKPVPNPKRRVRVAGPRPKHHSGIQINLLYRVLYDTHEELQATHTHMMEKNANLIQNLCELQATHTHMMENNAYLIQNLCEVCKSQQLKVKKLEQQLQEEREADQRYSDQMSKDYREEVQKVLKLRRRFNVGTWDCD